jgi:hypothetical protein
MNDTKFTPGPWAVSKLGMTNQGGKPIASEEKRVAVADLQTEVKRSEAWKAECAERDANAQLIAAAPTMAGYIKQKADEGCEEAARIWEQINAC